MSSRSRLCRKCGKKNRPYEVPECRKCGHPFLWRRKFGNKGYNRVDVYERRPGGELHVCWWDRKGANRESLTNLAGEPIFDRELAEKIGEAMADAQAKARRESTKLSAVLGIRERHSVGELFQRLHHDMGEGWSDKHLTGQKRFRRFWEAKLGKSTDITDVVPAEVSRIVAEQAREKGWSPKTQNHYLNAAVEAWHHAETQLKWIGPEHNLEAVRRHRIHVDNMEIAYTSAEAHRVLEELPAVDLRAAVTGELSYVGGRRLNAIMQLEIGAYRTESRIVPTDTGAISEEFGVVTFPAPTDKARKKGEVYLYGRSKELIERLIATPLCQASGLLIPRGDDLNESIEVKKPQTDKKLRRALREAERRAEVKSVKNRSFHAFNRTFSTDVEDTRAGSGQSGKTEDTMRRIYRQPKPTEKAALAMRLDGLRKGA